MSGNARSTNLVGYYSTFGSCHAHNFLYGMSLSGLIVCMICGPLGQFYSAGFSLNLPAFFIFAIVTLSLTLLLIGNRYWRPYLYLPVLALMVSGLIYAVWIIYNSYLLISKDVGIFQQTVQSVTKNSFGHEAAKIAVHYFRYSFFIHLTLVLMLLNLFSINLVLTDYFFMLSTLQKSALPFC